MPDSPAPTQVIENKLRSGSLLGAATDLLPVAQVAVVLVNYNSGGHLRRSLAAVACQTRPPQRVLVVDNASTDDSLRGIDAVCPGVELIRSPRNLGFAAANNLALARTGDCQWVALLNSDAFPEPCWLGELLAAAESRPDAAFFGSQLVSADEPTRLDGSGDVYHVSGLAWRRDWGNPRPARAGEPVLSPCAAAAMYLRSALVEAGGFDERYFCYFEDVDLGFRLRLRGNRYVYVPSAVAHHVGSASAGRQSDFQIYHGHRNLVWTYVKNMPAALFWLYLPQHLLANLASLVWFSLRGQGRAILRAKWDALAGLRPVLADRRRVQRGRKIGLREVRSLLSRGWLTPYRRRAGQLRAAVSRACHAAAAQGGSPWR
ncbi:MAG: glycosyltransferase family 2 protein [Pirellulales bacterium]